MIIWRDALFQGARTPKARKALPRGISRGLTEGDGSRAKGGNGRRGRRVQFGRRKPSSGYGQLSIHGVESITELGCIGEGADTQSRKMRGWLWGGISFAVGAIQFCGNDSSDSVRHAKQCPRRTSRQLRRDVLIIKRATKAGKRRVAANQ